jgi:hypothetical protein
MNSHDRRVTERYWPHCVEVGHDSEDQRYYDIIEWLNKNFGSCSFKKKKMPRWCWRPAYTPLSGFTMYWSGTQIFFRKEKDYMTFLLRWDGQ